MTTIDEYRQAREDLTNAEVIGMAWKDISLRLEQCATLARILDLESRQRPDGTVSKWPPLPEIKPIETGLAPWHL